MLLDEELTRQIIGAAIEVHRQLGPGMLESTYEACLCHELTKRGLAARRQVKLPVVYDGVRIECGYVIDLLVEDNVIIEIKSVEKVIPVHEAQLMTYLKLSGKRTGLLINFNVPLLINGITRRVL